MLETEPYDCPYCGEPAKLCLTSRVVIKAT